MYTITVEALQVRESTAWTLTYDMKVIEDLMHPDELIVQFIVRGRVGKKSVSICDKQVEHLHYLHTEDIHQWEQSVRYVSVELKLELLLLSCLILVDIFQLIVPTRCLYLITSDTANVGRSKPRLLTDEDKSALGFTTEPHSHAALGFTTEPHSQAALGFTTEPHSLAACSGLAEDTL